MRERILRMLLILAGTAAYLGVAVLGRGGPAAFFAQPALIALALVLVALSVVAVFAGGNVSPGVCEDRGNRWVLAAFALLGLLVNSLGWGLAFRAGAAPASASARRRRSDCCRAGDRVVDARGEPPCRR
jgi:hypothetical protein